MWKEKKNDTKKNTVDATGPFQVQGHGREHLSALAEFVVAERSDLKVSLFPISKGLSPTALIWCFSEELQQRLLCFGIQLFLLPTGLPCFLKGNVCESVLEKVLHASLGAPISGDSRSAAASARSGLGKEILRQHLGCSTNWPVGMGDPHWWQIDLR